MNSSQNLVFVGIDVSCDKLDVAWRNGGQWVIQTVAKTWAEAQKFAADLFAKMPDACKKFSAAPKDKKCSQDPPLRSGRAASACPAHRSVPRLAALPLMLNRWPE